MSEYLKNLPEGANLGFVFHDLHTQATDIIEEMDELRVAGYGGREEAGDQKLILGTGLIMNWGWSRGNRSGGYFTTHLSAYVAGESHRLVSARSFRADGDSAPKEASGVSGNRQDELGGDYSLSQQTSDESDAGMVTVSLRGMGARGRVDEPTGDTKRPPETPIETFLAKEGVDAAKRLELVTQGILDGIAMVEMVRDGIPATDVLEMMGRPVAEAA